MIREKRSPCPTGGSLLFQSISLLLKISNLNHIRFKKLGSKLAVLLHPDPSPPSHSLSAANHSNFSLHAFSYPQLVILHLSTRFSLFNHLQPITPTLNPSKSHRFIPSNSSLRFTKFTRLVGESYCSDPVYFRYHRRKRRIEERGSR